MTSPSLEQKAIVEDSILGTGNRVHIAYAGTGKTHTLRLISEANPKLRKRYIVFNKRNAEVVLPGTEVSTFNALGNKLLWTHGGFRSLTKNKTINLLRKAVWKLDSFDRETWFRARTISHAVSLAKNHCILSVEQLRDELPNLLKKYKLDTKFEPKDLFEVYGLQLKNSVVIDFDDQLFLPILLNIPLPQQDLLMLDEEQDCNPIKIEWAKRFAQNSRVIAVGDPFQSIYGFAGADPKATERLISTLGATSLTLSVNFRSSQMVIKEAQKIVPGITARDNAPLGAVNTVEFLRAEPGDVVLCRTTAPLVRECLALMKQGTKAFVLGLQLVEELIHLADSLGDPSMPASTAQDLLESKIEESPNMEDKCQVLISILGICSELGALRRMLYKIFKDDNDTTAIMFSTIHRAKGLEWDRVWLIRPDLIPHKSATEAWEQEQEMNCWYVANTRAKMEFNYVGYQATK